MSMALALSVLVKEMVLDAVGVMQKIKASLDPVGLMNPGKGFDL